MYIVTLTYTASEERVDTVRGRHREWLDQYVSSGVLLIAGPQVPRIGGIFVVSGALDRNALDAMLRDDPFHTEGVAEYSVVEFEATKVHPALAALV